MFLHVVDVSGRIWGCVEIIKFLVLGWKENGEVRMDVMAGGAAAGAQRRRRSRRSFQISYSVPTHGPEGPITL